MFLRDWLVYLRDRYMTICLGTTISLFRDFFLRVSTGILKYSATAFCRYWMLSSCSGLLVVTTLSMIC